MFSIIGFVFGNLKTFAIIGAVAAALGWLAYEHHSLIQQGVQQEIQDMNHANDKSNQEAGAAQGTVDDCFNTGGTWDRTNGVCTPAAGQ